MLVRALESIKDHCYDQIQALDLYANEKMQTAGLESPAELRRLLGSGFSGLRYLRLQGGLIDNQLFGALIGGLEPTLPVAGITAGASCRLSQVFLGPGSITDSAIDKLIAAAGHCLEVLAVTSCVDVGGGALASLLTMCPKLRVLSIHRSLARDKELLAGLGVETEAPGSAMISGGHLQGEATMKEVVAPLERLELGTVKLTVVGVAEIIKRTATSLRFLALETQHFQQDFLKDVIAPLCGKLEGLCFNEPERLPQQVQHQTPNSLRVGGEQWPRPRRWFFDLGRLRRALAISPRQIHIPHEHQAGAEWRRRGSRQSSTLQTRSETMLRHSSWLGETSADAWVLHGDCALWMTRTSEFKTFATADVDGSRGIGSNVTGHRQALDQTQVRSFSGYFQVITRRLASLLSTNDRIDDVDGHNSVAAVPQGLAAETTRSAEPSSEVSEREYEELLERFGILPGAIDAVLQSLQPSLKAFTAMKTDLMQVRLGQRFIETDGHQIVESTTLSDESVAPVDGQEMFMRLVVLLGVLMIGAAVSVSAA
ncbi:hypothetical protein EDD11_007594 [Mortierella claussenii]|nr:hypothetical protein EDD11_007594 [Mortierella claussenii]